MRKYVLYIMVYFASVVVMDLGFGFSTDYMESHAKGGAAKKLVDLCEKDHYDMLIMGSSKAHHNYIPQVFYDSLGMTCYNAGYDGNGIILAYGILSMIADDRLPKIIIYDIKQQFDIYHYNEDGDHTRYYKTLKPFWGNPAIDDIIKSISPRDVLLMHSSLYRKNGEFVSIVRNWLRNSPVDLNYGYKPLLGLISDESEQEKDYTNVIDTLKFGYFIKFVKLTKDKGVDLIVVLSPEYNTPFEKDFQPIRDFCLSEGVTVVDYFQEPAFLKKELFKDHCHMNDNGARVYSMALAHVLKTRELFQKSIE